MVRKLKIMHVGQLIGGLDVYIRNSILYNQVDNEYVLVHGKGDKSQPILRNGKLVPEYSISLFRSINPFKDLWALIQTVQLICKEKPDVIHCHSAKGGIIGRIAGCLTGTKTFYTPHAFSYLCTNSSLKRAIYLGVERLTKFKTYVLACSESEREMAISDVGYGPDRAFVWHNAVPDTSKEMGKKVNIDKPYICYIGRPSYQKNPLFLVDLIHEVKCRGCQVKFLLLGVGYHSPELAMMKDRIEELGISDTIQLVPWISHEDCQEYVRNSLFYLTTSLYEGLPLAVIEAMANSKTIVASDVVGNKDCVSHGKNGYLLPLEVNQFADVLCSLLLDKELLKKMSVCSRELFLKKFYIVNRIPLLQQIYEEVVIRRK